jgi:hypothetical protein
LFCFPAPTSFELISVNSTAEGVEFKFGEEGLQRFIVVWLDDEISHLCVIRRIHKDGGELLREQRIFLARFELFTLFAFELVGVGDEIFYAAKLLDECGGGFFAEAFHSRDVIDRISHEREDVDDLLGSFDTPAFTDFLHAEDFHVGARSGPVCRS